MKQTKNYKTVKFLTVALLMVFVSFVMAFATLTKTNLIVQAEGTTVDLSGLTADYVAQDGETLIGKSNENYQISIANGATVTLNGATIECNKGPGLMCNGNSAIVLEGTNVVRSKTKYRPGIFVQNGGKLTIKGNGSLSAYGEQEAPGIGGGTKENYEGDCGSIVIESGTINAYAGLGSVAIGAAPASSCSGIEIKGGYVNAYGGDEGGAGIGASSSANCEYITISGGKINAIGTDYDEYGYGCAGIGTSVWSSYCGNITISGGNITAKGGSDAPAIGVGTGYKLIWGEEEDDYEMYDCGCNSIVITEGVGKLALTKGNNSPHTVGVGSKYAECNNVSVLGVNGPLTTSPYNYLAEGPNGVIALIYDIPNPVVINDNCKKAIDTAREAYNNLKDEEKESVTNYDILTAAEEVFAVEYFNKKLIALPAAEDLTVENVDAIEVVIEAYNDLSDAQKLEISTENQNKYNEVLAKYPELKEANDTLKANAVKDQISALPAKADMTLDDKNKIDAAREAYDKLTDDQKAKVDNYELLVEAENNYRLKQVESVIDDIGEVEYPGSKAKIEAAEQAYESLKEYGLQDSINNVYVLVYAKQDYSILETTAFIDQIGTVEYSDECKDKIDAARTAYDALGEKLQGQIENYSLLEAAESKYAELKEDNDKADAVKELINKIGTVEYSDECKEDIDAARAAYNALSDTQKALVKNLDTLTSAETTYAELKENNEKADAVKELINNIGTVEYNSDNKAKIDAAKAAYDALTPEQKALVSNYNVLTEAEQTYSAKEAEANKRKGPSAGGVIVIILSVLLVLSLGAIVTIYILNKKGITHIAFVDKLFRSETVDSESQSTEE